MIAPPFGRDHEVFVTAEIGNNHEGDLETAKELVTRAAETGVNAVKFQTFIPEHYVSNADPARLKRLKEFQLGYDEFESLANLSEGLGLVFFSTPFDIASALALNSIQSIFKISSGDNNFFQLIDTVAGFGKPMIISTGLADSQLLDNVYSRVLGTWEKQKVATKLALLHCVSSYPVPFDEANLSAIQVLLAKYPEAVVGYSDHTIGIEAAVTAVAMGAKIIEKHFTLDKNFSEFRDHQLSADPKEMSELVKRIKRTYLLMGNGEIGVQPCERPMMDLGRRSAAARCTIQAGSTINETDIVWVRPGTGIPPGKEKEIIGRIAASTLQVGEVITIDKLATE